MTSTPCGPASLVNSFRGESRKNTARSATLTACSWLFSHLCSALAACYSPQPSFAAALADVPCSSCENVITKWYDEDFHNDNFEHTTAGTYGPANFQSETVAMVFWCHNKITSCQIKVDAVSIGETANATLLA